MTDLSQTSLRDDLADAARRLRQMADMQSVLRDGRVVRAERPAQSGQSGGGASAGRAARAERTIPPAASGAVPGRAPVAIAPAARVVSAVHSSSGSSSPAAAARVQTAWQRDPSEFATLGELHDAFGECGRCALAKTRTRFVFGAGHPDADVMFIGEAPGRDEDLQGEPFVGAAGQMLTKILDAIGFAREDVFIANILKCRPPGNRDPQPAEIAACSPILARQVETIRPLAICTLGAFAARTLLGVNEGISRLRGRAHEYRGIPVIPTYHPAALLRNPGWKRPTWEDVQRLRATVETRRAERRAEAGDPVETTP